MHWAYGLNSHGRAALGPLKAAEKPSRPVILSDAKNPGSGCFKELQGSFLPSLHSGWPLALQDDSREGSSAAC